MFTGSEDDDSLVTLAVAESAAWAVRRAALASVEPTEHHEAALLRSKAEGGEEEEDMCAADDYKALTARIRAEVAEGYLALAEGQRRRARRAVAVSWAAILLSVLSWAALIACHSDRI